MKILIVDDHALVRRGLNYVVKEGFPDAEVVEAESSAVGARGPARRRRAFDLALVDVRMPDLDGLELLRAVKAEWPDLPVIMLSTYENAPYVKRALADGAAGYLLEGRHARGSGAGDQRRDVGQRQRAQPARDPEPVRRPGRRSDGGTPTRPQRTSTA